MESAPFLKYKNIYIIPTFHSRIEFAKLVRKTFFMVYPDVICVELPDNVRDEVIEGINRLPYLSLIAYVDTLNTKQLNFIPIDPGDSIIESIRIGLEYKIPIEFIDLSVKDYAPPVYNLPDDHSLNNLSLDLFHEKIAEFIQKEDKEKKEALQDKITLEQFLKEQNQNGSQKEFDLIEKDILREKYMTCHLNYMIPLYNRILFVVGMAHWKSIQNYLEHPEKIENIDFNLIPHKYVKIYNIKSSDARFLLRELPYNTYKWIKFREKYSKTRLEQFETPEELYKIFVLYSKLDNIGTILLKAKASYEVEFKEFIDLHKLKTLFQYTRNLSLNDKRLLPNLTHLIVSSKNVVDDDYAWKVFEKATQYPYDDESKKYETLKLSAKGAYDPNGRYIYLRRHHPYQYESERDVPLSKKPKEEYKGQWKREWDEGKWNTVSWPPEDIIEEDYFAYLRKKGIKDLKNLRVKIEEFNSTLMDGIAIKETIRNWAFKKKIYVINEQPIQGKIDTLIVIFDEDNTESEKYPNKITWWAEHDKESDMAFYSTNPGDYLIGPGISHVEIGGFLSIFPPRRIPDVFKSYMDYSYKDTHGKAERLLKAGILFSKERYILYIAEKPPRNYFYSLAGIKNREIVFSSIDNFSKDSLKTIKHIHMLAGKDKRGIAHKYIFLDKK